MTNEQLNERINGLFAETKAGRLPRAERFKAIEQLTDEYIAANNERPDVAYLDRLASLCLHEELTDDTPWKTRNTEYPIHSDRQREEIEKNEASDKGLAYVGVKNDGRRKRSDYDNTTVNKAKSWNEERRRTYREFTKVQPVMVSWLPE